MQIQTFSGGLPQVNNLPQAPKPPEDPKPPSEKWDSVTFDSATNTYHFEKPGHHYSAARMNPLKEGLTGAALIGIPSAVGALQNAALGGLGATAVTAIAGPTLGAVIGGVWMGHAAYKGTNENPIYTGLAAIAGAGVGAVAFPLLQLPGVWGGATGAAGAAGGIGVAVALWALSSNHKLDQKALDAGYKPQS